MKRINDLEQVHSLVVGKMPMNKEFEFELNKEHEWVRNLLEELNEEAADMSIAQKLADSNFDIKLKITRKYKADMADYVLVSGSFETNYYTECVRTLTTMRDSLSVEFAACFVGEEYETDERFAEQTDIFTDNQVWELHFFENGSVNIKEFLHEIVYLEKDPYPCVDEDSPLQTNSTRQ